MLAVITKRSPYLKHFSFFQRVVCLAPLCFFLYLLFFNPEFHPIFFSCVFCLLDTNKSCTREFLLLKFTFCNISYVVFIYIAIPCFMLRMHSLIILTFVGLLICGLTHLSGNEWLKLKFESTRSLILKKTCALP